MSNQNETGNELVLYGIVIAGAAFLIWYTFGYQLAWLFIAIKKAEYWILKMVFLDKIIPEIWSRHITPEIEMILLGESTVDIKKFNVLSAVGSGVGFFSRWIYAIASIAIAVKVYKANPLLKFRRSFSMKTLAASEQRLWPAIAPVVNLNLIEQDIHVGPWAMSRKPLDFARHYKLLDDSNKLNRERAEKLFAMQLGKLWEGPQKLNNYTKALFAAFAAQACGDIKEAQYAMEQLAKGMAAGKVDYSWVNSYIKKYENEEVVKNVIQKHAYVYTVMAGMLKAARGFGVCASSNFIWLRPKNRALWYTLNGVGRNVSFAEVAGIYGHGAAEEVANHPIEKPFVIKAVDGLERALLEVIID